MKIKMNIVFTHQLTHVVLLTKPHHSPITTGIYDVELWTPLGTHPILPGGMRHVMVISNGPKYVSF